VRSDIFSGSVLGIAAHPDDLEYGCFGTLFKFRSNFSLAIYIASLGGENDPTSGLDRKRECENALAYLNPDKIVFREKVGVDSYLEIVQELETIIKSENVSLVLVPSHRDSHQDHRKVSKMAISAIRRSDISVLFYSLLSSDLSFRARLFVDITDCFYLKMKALKSHKSQSQKYYMSEKYLEIFHSDSFANLHGIECVERFEIDRLFL